MWTRVAHRQREPSGEQPRGTKTFSAPSRQKSAEAAESQPVHAFLQALSLARGLPARPPCWRWML